MFKDVNIIVLDRPGHCRKLYNCNGLSHVVLFNHIKSYYFIAWLIKKSPFSVEKTYSLQDIKKNRGK